MKILTAILVGLAFCGSACAQGYSTPAEQRYSPFSGDIPSCDDPGVLSTITSRFAQKESEYWNSALEIEGYDRIREIGFRSNGAGYIPRRYCVARAQMNDLEPRAVIYTVQQNLGVIGWGYGVEWCVVGLDRNLAYAPGCQAARPIVDTDIVGGGAMQAIIRALLRTSNYSGNKR
ncbi:MAG: hypothetical protein ABSC22_10660 [Roseiarcus sp.]